MNISEFHKLVRKLQDLAVLSTAVDGQKPISIGQLTIVEDILKHDPTTVGEVTERTGFAQSFVSKTVAGLKVAGMIRVARSKTDKRQTILHVLPAARVQMRERQGQGPITLALHGLLPQATAKQLREIEQLLETLNSVMT